MDEQDVGGPSSIVATGVDVQAAMTISNDILGHGQFHGLSVQGHDHDTWSWQEDQDGVSRVSPFALDATDGQDMFAWKFH